MKHSQSVSLVTVFALGVVLACAGCATSVGDDPTSPVFHGYGDAGPTLHPDAHGGDTTVDPSTEDTGTTLHPDTTPSGAPDTKTPSGPTDTGSSPPPPVDSGSTGAADTSTGPVTPPSGDDSACGAMSTNSDCQSCCATNHSTAYDAFVTALADCACTSSVCKYKCSSSFCASSPSAPTSTCGTCLDSAQSGACSGAITTACTGGGPCQPFNDCVQTQCAALP